MIPHLCCISDSNVRIWLTKSEWFGEYRTKSYESGVRSGKLLFHDHDFLRYFLKNLIQTQFSYHPRPSLRLFAPNLLIVTAILSSIILKAFRKSVFFFLFLQTCSLLLFLIFWNSEHTPCVYTCIYMHLKRWKVQPKWWSFIVRGSGARDTRLAHRWLTKTMLWSIEKTQIFFLRSVLNTQKGVISD